MLGHRWLTPWWEDVTLRRQESKKTDGETGHHMAEGDYGAVSISLRNHNCLSLGPEGSMSKVGTPPPQNLDKSHGLVVSININNNNNMTNISSMFQDFL